LSSDDQNKDNEKEYGVNETIPDPILLNKKPNFSEDFEKEILSGITK